MQRIIDESHQAYHRGDLNAGRAACEWLLSQDQLTPDTRAMASRNLPYYSVKLEDLATVTYRNLAPPVSDGWSRFNPTLAVSGSYLYVLVRSSNYHMDEQMRYTIHDPDQIIRTEYVLGRARLDWSELQWFPVDYDIPQLSDEGNPFQVWGLEDARLIVAENGALGVCGTVRNNPQGICQMVSADLVFIGDYPVITNLRELSLLSERHQKNWMPRQGPATLPDTTYVERCAPLASWHQGASFLPGKDHPFLREARGSSQLVEISPGVLLALVHEVAHYPNGSRTYRHRFLQFDDNLEPVAVSRQFSFHNQPVEFCAGLALIGDRLHISYGVWDREAWVVDVPVNEVMDLLKPLDFYGELPTIVSVTLAGPGTNGVIEDALASLTDQVSHHFVMITSGDYDYRIKGPARRKTTLTYETWPDDFGAARTMLLNQAGLLHNSLYQWAIMLDTDERVEFTGHLGCMLKYYESDIALVDMAAGYQKDRVFRLPVAGSYVGPVHEAFIARGSRGTLSGLVVQELPKSPDQIQHKLERDRAALEAYTEAHPHDPRWFYYLGDTYANLNLWEQALHAWQQCYELDGWDEESAWSCYRIAKRHYDTGQHADAVAWGLRGMSRHAGIAELPILIGLSYAREGRTDQARRFGQIGRLFSFTHGIGAQQHRINFKNETLLSEGLEKLLKL